MSLYVTNYLVVEDPCELNPDKGISYSSIVKNTLTVKQKYTLQDFDSCKVFLHLMNKLIISLLKRCKRASVQEYFRIFFLCLILLVHTFTNNIIKLFCIMKKAVLVPFVVICCSSAMALSVFAYKSGQPSLLDSNVEALAQVENYPLKSSPIWKVTYHNSGSSEQTIDCETGGAYSCPEK